MYQMLIKESIFSNIGRRGCKAETAQTPLSSFETSTEIIMFLNNYNPRMKMKFQLVDFLMKN